MIMRLRRLPMGLTPALTVALLWCRVLTAQQQTPAAEPPPAVPTGDGNGAGEATGDSALERYTDIAASFAAEAEKPRQVRFHRCLHIRGETLAQVLENFMTPAGTVAANEESDMVVISDVESNLPLLLDVADNLDQPVSQVLVEARIVEFSIDSDFQKEINVEFQKLDNVSAIPNLPANHMDFVHRLTDAFVDPGSNPLATRGSVSYMHWDAGKESLITAFVRFLENKGKAKILSSPNLILRRGTEGSIVTGEEVPIQTQTITSGSLSTSTTFKNVGIKLRVKPVAVSGGRIRLLVNPEVSNVTRYDERTGAPIIAIRNAGTELDVGNAQLVSIGGLLRSEESERQRRMPILSSIPLLGHLFRGTVRRTVQTQLVIFLRATVLEEEMNNLPSVRNLELPPELQLQVDREERKLSLPRSGLLEDIRKLSDSGGPGNTPETGKQ